MSLRALLSWGLFAAGVLFTSPASAVAQPDAACAVQDAPTFAVAFVDLKAQVGDAMGDPIECDHFTDVGDIAQVTTTGQAIYRQSIGVPTFTNGSEHWAITGEGLVYWTGGSIDPPGVSAAVSPQDAPVQPSQTVVAPRAALSEADVASLIAPSVVQIVSEDGSGSGVNIPEGILTNAHVVKGHAQVQVIRSDGRRATGTVIRLDDVRDVAILSTDLPLQAVDREPAAQQRQGDTVLVFGHPLGIGGQPTLTRGLLSATRLDRNGVSLVQTDAAINPGNSGGPIVNIRGKLVGIVSWGFSQVQGLSFGIATESIQAALEGAPIPPTSSGSTTPVATPPVLTGSWRVWLPDAYDTTGMAVDRADNVYVAMVPGGGQGTIRKYSPEGTLLTSWPTRGNGLAIDDQGYVYQASTWDAAVKKFSPSGQLLSSFGSRGSGAGQFNDPLNVAVDSAAGVFYVADAGNNRVQKWTTEGRLLAAVPVSGRAYRVTLDPAGTVWAFTDTGLYHISAELKVMDQVATKNGRGEVIAFDASGNLYMADPPLIYQVSPSGTGQSWGSAGGAPGQFSSWIDWLAVDSQGRIYVLDHGNKRIQQFTP